jgi:cell division protein FtsB
MRPSVRRVFAVLIGYESLISIRKQSEYRRDCVFDARLARGVAFRVAEVSAVSELDRKPESWWAYYKRVRQHINSEEAKWARDNLVIACGLGILILLVLYLLYRVVPDFQTLIATLWVFGVSLLVFIVASFARAPWKLDGKRKEENDTLRKEKTELERQKAEAEKRIYDGRPLFVLEVSALLTSKGKTWMLGLKNVGTRPARYVNMETQASFQKQYHMQFAQILALPSNQSEELRFVILGDHFQEIHPKGGADNVLMKFLNDIERHDDPLNDAALIWWDIPIKFRDTDESVKEELTRLCFDVERNFLYATVPPYTERGFNPPS